jgi:hypothetical protein
MQASQSNNDQTARISLQISRNVKKQSGNKTTRTAPSSHLAPCKPSTSRFHPASSSLRLGEGVFTDHATNPQEQKQQKCEINAKLLIFNIFSLNLFFRRQLPLRRWLDFPGESREGRRIGWQSLWPRSGHGPQRARRGPRKAVASHHHVLPAPQAARVARMSGGLGRAGTGWR